MNIIYIMKPYSYDLRLRVVLHYRLIKSLRKTSKTFLISKSSVSRWNKLYKIDKLHSKKKIRIKYKITKSIIDLIKKIVDNKVFVSLKEIKYEIKKNYKIDISLTSISKTLKQLNYSIKKIYPFVNYKNQPNSIKISDHKSKIFNLMKSNNLICIDETHFCKNMIPKYGRSLKGKKINHEVHDIYNKKMCSCIMAISNNKIIYYELYEGSVTSDVYISFLSTLVTKLNIDKDILYMDNAAAHRSKKTREYMNNANIKYRYNLPYSPELNPIEMVFAKIKKILRYNLVNTKDNIIKLINETIQQIDKHEMNNYYKHSFC